MVASLDPYPYELPSTYIVMDRPNEEELVRLTIQDRSITALMGILPEQPDPNVFHDVLDIASGAGGWIIQAAQNYPTMSLVGIDISKQMITYARKQTELHQVSDRVRFQMMDVQHKLGFPDESFDLVNMRLASSFLRTWDWNKVVGEILRVLRPAGIARITETETDLESNSPALTQFTGLFRRSLHKSGHLFDETKNGCTAYLAELLENQGCAQVQTRPYALEYSVESPEWQALYDNMRRLYRTLRPFLQRWGGIPKNYDEICQQALYEMQRPDFHAIWRFLTVWGYRAH